MRVLVTGGCGYVGSKLTAALLSRDGCQVTVLDAMWFGNRLSPHPRLTVLEHDMRRIDAVDLSGLDPIFHLANIANDPAVELNPCVVGREVAACGSPIGRRPGPKDRLRLLRRLRDTSRASEEMPLNPISGTTRRRWWRSGSSASPDSLVTTIIRPATVCGPSPRMRLDLTVNLLTMQALTKGAMTVLGGSQIRPNIHIDDLVQVYLFAWDRRLAGVYNAGFENLSILDIARCIASHVPAEVQILPSNDPRSYRQCSDRLVAAGFVPSRTVSTAIDELAGLYAAGRLRDDPASHNVSWMKQHNLS